MDCESCVGEVTEESSSDDFDEEFSDDSSEADSDTSFETGSVGSVDSEDSLSVYNRVDSATPPTPPESNLEYDDLSQMTLFPHQRLMVAAVQACLCRGYINVICGAGKSLAIVMCCKAVWLSVIFVPFKTLVEQFYRQYLSHDDSIDVILVNSDYLVEIAGPNPERRTIYIANYDSAHRIAELSLHFDLVCWDEGHLATSHRRRALSVSSSLEEITENAETINAADVKISSVKHIFWTATPNAVMKNHPETFGEELFSYNFHDAVSDCIIKSFNLLISCYKHDDGRDETFEYQFEKIVDQITRFITDTERKRILIYVNRVQEDPGVISVMQMQKASFPPKWTVDSLCSKTTGAQRKYVFERFRDELLEGVHVIISCRTISVGVDLPNCDAVVFAGTTKNVTEIIQRGCRPCRLTKNERASGDYRDAMIFFPVNVSAAELYGALRDEKVTHGICNSPLEVPMTVLELLKKGLDLDLDFTKYTPTENVTRSDTHSNRRKSAVNQTTTGGTGISRRIGATVHVWFPYCRIDWTESPGAFSSKMNQLCVTSRRVYVKDSVFKIKELAARYPTIRPRSSIRQIPGPELPPTMEELKWSKYTTDLISRGRSRQLSKEMINEARCLPYIQKALEMGVRKRVFPKEKIRLILTNFPLERPSQSADASFDSNQCAKWLSSLMQMAGRCSLQSRDLQLLEGLPYWAACLEGYGGRSLSRRLDKIKKLVRLYPTEKPHRRKKGTKTAEEKWANFAAMICQKAKQQCRSAPLTEEELTITSSCPWLHHATQTTKPKVSREGRISALFQLFPTVQPRARSENPRERYYGRYVGFLLKRLKGNETIPYVSKEEVELLERLPYIQAALGKQVDKRPRLDKLKELMLIYPDNRPKLSECVSTDEQKWGRFVDSMLSIVKGRASPPLSPEEERIFLSLPYVKRALTKPSVVSRLKELAILYPNKQPREKGSRVSVQEGAWSTFVASVKQKLRSLHQRQLMDTLDAEEGKIIQSIPYFVNYIEHLDLPPPLDRLQKLSFLQSQYPNNRPRRKGLNVEALECSQAIFVENLRRYARDCGKTRFSEDEIAIINNLPYLSDLFGAKDHYRKPRIDKIRTLIELYPTTRPPKREKYWAGFVKNLITLLKGAGKGKVPSAEEVQLANSLPYIVAALT